MGSNNRVAAALWLVLFSLLIVCGSGCGLKKSTGPRSDRSSVSARAETSLPSRGVDREIRELFSAMELYSGAGKAAGSIESGPDEAYRHYESAIELFFGGKDREAGFREIQAAIRLASEERSPFYVGTLGEMYYVSGKSAEALEQYLKAAELVDKLQAYGYEAGLREDKPPACDSESEQAKKLAYLYNFRAASLLEQTRSYQKAELRYEKTLALLSAYPPIVWDSQRRCIRADPIRDVLEHEAASRLEQVRAKLARRRPTREWIRKDLGSAWLQPPTQDAERRKDPEMVELQAKLKVGTTGGPRPHFLLGQSYFQAGMVDKAVVEFLAAVEIDPASLIEWHWLGRTYLWQGRLDDAAAAFQKAGELGHQESARLATRVQAAADRFGQSTSQS